MEPARSIVRAIAVLLVSMLIGLAAGILWIGQTTSFVRWALARAEEATAGALQADEVSGSLLAGVEIAELRWVQPGVRVEISRLKVRWRAAALLGGELRLGELRAGRVSLELEGSETGEAAPALPERIELPVKIAIDSFVLDELELAGGAFSVPAVRDLAASLRLDGRSLRLPRLAAGIDGWGKLEIEAKSALSMPFETSLRARFEPAIADRPHLPAVLLEANGPIEALSTRLRMLAPAHRPGLGNPDAGTSAWVLAETTLRLFEPLPVRTLSLSLEGFEPDAIGLQGPRARFSGNLQLEARPANAQTSPPAGAPARPGLADTAWQGRVTLSNALPGPLDAGLLPFGKLQSDLRWAGGRLAFESIDLDSGLLRGEVAVDTTVSRPLFGVNLPKLAAKLALRELDPSALHRQAWPARLSGEIVLDDERFGFSLADATRRDLRLAGRASLQGERVQVASLNLRTPSGSIELAGNARWQAPWQVDFAGRFAGLDPARLAAIAGIGLPQPVQDLQDLRGEWAASGELAPVLSLDSRLTITEGRFGNRPLRVDWRGKVSPERLSGIALAASLGSLSARLSGDAGHRSDRMRVALHLPSLAAVDPILREMPGLQGAVSVEGEISLPGLEASALQRSEFALRIEARGLRHQAVRIGRASVALDGTPEAHRLTLEVAEAGADSIAAKGALAVHGGLVFGGASSWRWEGRAERLALELPLAVTLAAPMPLRFEPGGVRAGPASLHVDGAPIEISGLGWRDGRFDLAGRAQAVPVSRWAGRFGLIPKDAAAIDEVRLGGKWAFAGSSLDDLDGELQLQVATSARLDADGQVELRLQQGALSGRIDLALPSLSVFNRAIGPEWAVAGRLRAVAELSGTVGRPAFAGTLEGRDLTMVQRRLGWRLGDGVLEARFDGDRLEVQTLRLASGEGAVTLDGSLLLEAAEGDFRLLAQRLAVPLGPGQRIVLSGETRILSRAAELKWAGKIRADEGLIELRGGEAPSLPEDVTIVDASAPPDARSLPAEPASALKLGADLEVDLGERIRVRGSGVDARLAGSLRLRGTLPDAPRATGTVRIRDGTYTAYGQKLEISRGRVIFNGPLDNPVLDITAMRRGPAVEAGVALSGTVLSPRVRLVSEPEVPDSQKLSWLVLGVGPEDARTGGQIAALQAAAATLFGGDGGGLISEIQESFGLDVLTIRNAAASGFDANFGASFPGQAGTGSTPTTGATQDVIAIGKRFGSRTMLTYEQGLRGIWSLVRLQYDITRRLSLRAQTGTDTAVDLLYFYSFD